MRFLKMLAVAALVAPLGGCGYNRIQELDEQAEQAKSNIGVELEARNKLIPNMVATVEGAAEFERGTYTEVARARSGLEAAGQQMQRAVAAKDVQQMEAADAAVTGQMRAFLNIAVEAYPQLRATENFTRLQDQLAGSENRIATARRDYNGAVQRYNSHIRKFPTVITARITGADRKEPYEAPAGAETPPTVDFSRTGGGASGQGGAPAPPPAAPAQP